MKHYEKIREAAALLENSDDVTKFPGWDYVDKRESVIENINSIRDTALAIVGDTNYDESRTIKNKDLAKLLYYIADMIGD